MHTILRLITAVLPVFVSLSAFAFQPDKRFEIDLGQPFCESAILGGTAELPNTLKILSWNVQNVGQAVGKQERTSATSFERSKSDRDRGFAPKLPWQKDEILRILLTENPDVATFTEVESLRAANELIDSNPTLKARYQKFLIEGNDERGIDILTLVRKSLPVTARYESFKGATWKDPAEGDRRNPLFSRDVPALSLFAKGAKTPSYIVLGNHAKSMRHRPGDDNSEEWRTAQYQGIRQIYEFYREKYGDRPQIILQGDFNLDVQKDPALDPVREVLTSAFEMSPAPIDPRSIITHTFHPREVTNREELRRFRWARPTYRNLPAEKRQMDDIRLSHNMEGRVLKIYIVQMRGEGGLELTYANSYRERQRQPSDHWPLAAELEAFWILD